jgi:cell division protease FtsH
VIAASNRAELLDRALLRRFSRQIEVELPTRADREQYLRTRLGAKARHGVSAEMIERLAAQDQGLSIADLERILAEAAVMAIANDALIDDGILSEAFEKITLGEAEAGSDPRRTAYHEAGHALLMCLTGRPPIYVTTVGRGSFGGYAAFEDREERRAQTKGELEALLCQMLGGREAECLYYGENGGQSTGPATDLKEATRLAEAMVYDYGMSPEVGFVRIDRRQPVPAEISVQCHAAVRALLEAQTQRAQQLLSNHRSSFEAIATALLERNRLLRHELLELLTPRERELAEGSAE